MFTGLISDIGTILAVEDQPDLRRIRIACSYKPKTILIGASIACSGPCLTAINVGVQEKHNFFDVQAAAETLERTTVSNWQVGDKLNLERSLKIGDELGGHIVTGHIDGKAELVNRVDFNGTARFDFKAPKDLARFIATKGSIALDGTSLTVNSVDNDCFSVLLIPHTLAVTTWGASKTGDHFNIEVDLMARYAARLTLTIV
jgi:riboflavin synthase